MNSNESGQGKKTSGKEEDMEEHATLPFVKAMAEEGYEMF